MIERPDLSRAPAEVVAYVEALEAELVSLRGRNEVPRAAAPAALPDEPPTPYAIITISRRGVAKRTPRHLYGRQRRGGMGVFDLDDKQYIALEPLDESNDVYLYGYQRNDTDFDLLDIPEEEFDRVAAEFDRLMDEPI